jgi:uncharacterized protein (TIGR00369 family)
MAHEISLSDINNNSKNTLLETLSIKIVKANKNEVVATMPVNSKVHQVDGVLHGGATVALAETAGSVAAYLSIDQRSQIVSGIEISANHLKSVRSGLVTAVAKPLHRGRTTQLWQIKISNDRDELISLCKLTTIVLAKK